MTPRKVVKILSDVWQGLVDAWYLIRRLLDYDDMIPVWLFAFGIYLMCLGMFLEMLFR